MAESYKDDGVIISLIKRFETQGLQVLNALNEKRDKGERLSDADIVFLDAVIHDAQQDKPLMDRHPEWQAFCGSVIHLYETITSKALYNEKST